MRTLTLVLALLACLIVIAVLSDRLHRNDLTANCPPHNADGSYFAPTGSACSPPLASVQQFLFDDGSVGIRVAGGLFIIPPPIVTPPPSINFGEEIVPQQSN